MHGVSHKATHDPLDYGRGCGFYQTPDGIGKDVLEVSLLREGRSPGHPAQEQDVEREPHDRLDT